MPSPKQSTARSTNPIEEAQALMGQIASRLRQDLKRLAEIGRQIPEEPDPYESAMREDLAPYSVA